MASAHEWKALREAARQSMRSYMPLAIDLAIFAGLRRSEILNLPITGIKDGCIYVTNQKHKKTKNHKTRIIPINAELQHTLDQYKPHPNAMRLIHTELGQPLGDIKERWLVLISVQAFHLRRVACMCCVTLLVCATITFPFVTFKSLWATPTRRQPCFTCTLERLKK